ncbi:MAG: M3 family oligoendopeptidase [Spirochaetales bacterium]|nr:M3 family oligoendopeptidase [Spirochaetales bacterium]
MDTRTWNLTSIYPSSHSPEFQRDLDELSSLAHSLQSLFTDYSQLSSLELLKEAVGGFNRLGCLHEHLESYVYALWSGNTQDEEAQRLLDTLEARALAAKDAQVRFRALLPSLASEWEQLLSHESLKPYEYWLQEQMTLAHHQMSPAEEALAADLQRSGGDAWDRLQGKLVSSLSRPWKDGQKTLSELRALAYHKDRPIRRKAWEEECALLQGAEASFAAALNGVKGTSDVLNTRRNWNSTLERSLSQNRLTEKALHAMLDVMDSSLPIFRRYFHAKAKHLGLEKLSWFDLFAPLGGDGGVWTWEKAQEFISKMFDRLHPQMGNFARRAFAEQWIDVDPRPGKVGGAYCTHLPLTGESRILCNFDGSFDSVSTVAHELGHAWHGEVLKEASGLHRDYPMTLAETASIFSETLVFQGGLEGASSQERPGILDTYLMGASQVVVDILSRFRFEKNLMVLRREGELSPQKLSQLMAEAQESTYGEGLNPEERHPWMWAVKGHYYAPDLAFYNFPYAFGQLFALGLYAIYEQEGPTFFARYNTLLGSAGKEDAATVARSAGFDIEEPQFWQGGIQRILTYVEEMECLTAK